jgi:hypothetical protein
MTFTAIAADLLSSRADCYAFIVDTCQTVLLLLVTGGAVLLYHLNRLIF